MGVFILISTLPAGWLTDRFGEKRMVAMAGLVAVVGTIIALSIPSLPIIYVGGCIIGISFGFFYYRQLGTGHAPGSQGGSRVATWAFPTWQVRVQVRLGLILVVPSPILSPPRCLRCRVLGTF